MHTRRRFSPAPFPSADPHIRVLRWFGDCSINQLAMDTLIMLLFLASGRHPGTPSRPYNEALHGRCVVWHDPGRVERADFRYGPGGAALEPRMPFHFVREDTSGTTPKVFVRDGRGRMWQVRFGPKAGADVFSSRLAWAVGYYVEPTYYFAQGTILGAHDLRRARHYIDDEGHFENARFELRSNDPKFLTNVGWAWNANPFVGTHELGGLKTMVMLVSDWDDKDQRQAKKLGSNTGIYRVGGHYEFFMDDWGRSMGKWGGPFSRSTWDAGDFFRQTPKFIKGVTDGQVEFGYKGHNTKVMSRGVTVADVRWLMQYLGRITDAQLRTGLLNCGATPGEQELFVTALRSRIRQLQMVAQTGGAPRVSAAY